MKRSHRSGLGRVAAKWQTDTVETKERVLAPLREFEGKQSRLKKRLQERMLRSANASVRVKAS